MSYLITSGGNDDDMMTLRRLPLPDFIRCLSVCQGNQAVKRGANLGTPPQNAVSHSVSLPRVLHSRSRLRLMGFPVTCE